MKSVKALTSKADEEKRIAKIEREKNEQSRLQPQSEDWNWSKIQAACKDKVWTNKQWTWICWVFSSLEGQTQVDLHVIQTYLFSEFL